MGFRDTVIKNTPRVELHSINSLIVGGYKSGKTRLWKEVTELHYPNNPEAALLIAFEPGYETWELENIVPIHKQGANEDEWKVWEFFKKEVVPGLIQEAKEGRIVQLIGIDTADKCVDAATAWVLKDRSKKYAKVFSSIQEISDSTSENGWTILYNELNKQFNALDNAGYKVMGLAWTKEKETTFYNGKKYNSIELMMHNTAKKIFESQASFICCLFNEVKILDKEGNELEENIKDKKGKEKAAKFHETETYMYFRPSQYISIAGGRFTNLPEKEPYSAENFLKVFENAVLGQLKKTNKSVEQIREEENRKREEKIREEVKKPVEPVVENVSENEIEEVQETLENVVEKIIAKAKELEALDKANVKKAIKIIGNKGDVRKIPDIETAKVILDKLENFELQ